MNFKNVLFKNYLSFTASADRLFHLAKKEGTIQYGYRTWGTHARVFSQTLAHGNSKNEIRQRNRRRHKEERREYGKKQSEHEKKDVPTAYRILIKKQ